MWGAIGSLVGSVAGNILDRNSAKSAAQKQNKYNVWLQENNQEFQKYMAENAHQMEIDDLKKAGLNPVLSANGSSAGSIASSSSAQGTSAGQAGGKFGDVINKAAEVMQTNSATDLNKKQGELAQAQTLESQERAGTIKPEAEARIKNSNSATAVNKAKAQEIQSKIELNKLEKQIKEGGVVTQVLGTDPSAGNISALVSGAILGGAGGTAMKTAGSAWKALKKLDIPKRFMKSMYGN